MDEGFLTDSEHRVLIGTLLLAGVEVNSAIVIADEVREEGAPLAPVDLDHLGLDLGMDEMKYISDILEDHLQEEEEGTPFVLCGICNESYLGTIVECGRWLMSHEVFHRYHHRRGLMDEWNEWGSDGDSVNGDETS